MFITTADLAAELGIDQAEIAADAATLAESWPPADVYGQGSDVLTWQAAERIADDRKLWTLVLTHDATDGTILNGTTKGDGSAAALRTARGWKWSRNLGAWYRPNSRDRAPNQYAIKTSADALRAAGFRILVAVDATPRDMVASEAARAARSDDRTAALEAKAARKDAESTAHYETAHRLVENIPAGQPILTGHHSERGHRRALDRSWAHMGKSVALSAEAKLAAERAKSSAATTGHRHNPLTIARRIERQEADRRKVQRSLDGYTTRSLDGHGRPVYVHEYAPASGEYRERLLAQAAELDNELTYWRAELAKAQADGRVFVFDPKQCKKGDAVRIRGQWRAVDKVNRVTVAVTTGYGWTDKAPFHEVTGHRRDGVAVVYTTAEAEPVDVDAVAVEELPAVELPAVEPVAVEPVAVEPVAVSAVALPSYLTGGRVL